MKLPRAFADEIIAHARADAPNECCGIIAGNGGHATQLYRAINAAASPYRYEVDPKDLFRITKEIDAHDWEVTGIYHSHVATAARPSQTDVRLAYYPEAYYLLVSLGDPEKPEVSPENPDLCAYRIVDGQVTEEPIEYV
jgi:proteasome lid subunit RPN8/RPN11